MHSPMHAWFHTDMIVSISGADLSFEMSAVLKFKIYLALRGRQACQYVSFHNYNF